MKFPNSLFPDFDFKKVIPKRGHAGNPGRGPEGEKCKTCFHIYRNRLAKVYLKCELNEKNWTGGSGSDIRANDPACEFWEPQP